MGKSRTKSLWDFRAFEGADGSLATSIFEYGLAWRLYSKSRKEYAFVYGLSTGYSVAIGHFTRFAYTAMTKKDFSDITHEGWFNLSKVAAGSDITVDDFVNAFPYTVSDAIAYYGIANIFGECYYEGFEIKGDKDNDKS